jgi:hypothetical protein
MPKKKAPEEDTTILPEQFVVYVLGKTARNAPAPGFTPTILPTYNHYTGEDGGYVAVYTRARKGAVYSVGGGINVVGLVRVQGHYVGRIFYPQGYDEGDDITRDPNIVALCETYFPQLKGKVWPGGDTGGWFGDED